MSTKYSRRLALAMLTATPLFAAACTSSTTAQLPDAGTTPDAGTPPDATIPDAGPTITRFALQNGMRSLWQDHVTWTRVYLVSAIGNLPDTGAAAERLLKNQTDIGNAIKPFYGAAAGTALTALLHDHITIATEVVGAAKAGDAAALANAKTRWYANGDAIATFLAGANPNWPLADLKDMMRMHLDTTLDEAVARLGGDWAADVVAYDAVVAHILAMSDVLADGIAKQFPEKFSTATPPTAKNQELHLGMRKLWTDHVTWTRSYLMSAVAGLPDEATVAGRLLQNQADLGNAIKPFYGDAAGDQLVSVLRDHIVIATEVVAAAKGGDANALADARDRWYANGDDIAVFLSSANPYWPLTDLRQMMRMHLDQTFDEAAARLGGDWAKDVATYDAIVLHILAMADTLSDGIAVQFPEKLR